MSRIIDQLSFKKFKKHPKWIVGYSDITVLHAHLYSKYGISSLHAPMAAAFNDEGYLNSYIASLKSALEGNPASYEAPGHIYNISGEAEGQLVGGNLSLVVHLTGSVSEFKTKNKILFLEDVGEYLYSIDRMMIHLKRAGKFDKLNGLILGGFTDSKDTDRPYGKAVDEILNEYVKDFDFPVCFHFPVSHEDENYALKIGGNYTLTVRKETVSLEEGSVE